MTFTLMMATTSVTSALAQPEAQTQDEALLTSQVAQSLSQAVAQSGVRAAEQAAAVVKKATKKTTGQRAVSTAKKYIGTPYVYGGSSPKTGFDCSGLMYYVYKKIGVKLPRTAQGQYNASKSVSKSKLKPGDLVFFGSDTSSIYHVGMYVCKGKYIHSPQTGDTVKIASLSERSNFVAAARPCKA